MKNQRKTGQKPQKNTKEVVTFELEKDLVPALKNRAKQFERSMSGHLRVLVKEDLKPEVV